ncbi:hypothetical protein [Pseudomonas gingeri]|uniref:hypothetical protein n=1 Tax=Pseudomonas gingeri TaxID=117681 RepID=UPI0015A02F2D|nr:hypothetical protein [Pseudomonas gingeri]NWA11957.1 hypothetical protein [Pseudomonas gingeri]
MNINYNGRQDTTTGHIPKHPVKWTATFCVVDSDGNALENKWTAKNAPPMTYTDAKTCAHKEIENMKSRLFERNKRPIKKAVFDLNTRCTH